MVTGTDNPPGPCRPCRGRTSVQGSWGPLSAVQALGRPSGAQHTCPPQEGTSILSGNRTSQSGTKEGRGRPPSPALRVRETHTLHKQAQKEGARWCLAAFSPGDSGPGRLPGWGREGAATVNAWPRRCGAVGKLVQYLPASRPLVLAPCMFRCNCCTGCVTVSPKVHIWGVLRSW